eukprot:IDg1856t1
MDERGMHIWFEKIWRPHSKGLEGTSALLLDDFVCHTQAQFKEKLQLLNTLAPIVPAGYTCVLQPCDVGMNKPIKTRLQGLANAWRAEKYVGLESGDRLPTPGGLMITNWLNDALMISPRKW